MAHGIHTYIVELQLTCTFLHRYILALLLGYLFALLFRNISEILTIRKRISKEKKKIEKLTFAFFCWYIFALLFGNVSAHLPRNICKIFM